MASFDPKSIRQRRRNKVRSAEDLRELNPENPGALDVSRLMLAEIPANLALRVSLALLLRVLRLRGGTLPDLSRERLRQNIIELVHELANADDSPLPAPITQTSLVTK
jgi:hypothetical protein